jgi:PKD repeat protein
MLKKIFYLLPIFLISVYQLIWAEDYNLWSNYVYLYLNTTSSGANISSNLTGFPILVRLSGSNFPAGAKNDGSDIRFSTSSGTHLPYQIERWDNANQQAEIWVKTDVLGNNNTQYIIMYWGKSDAADSSNGSAVFDTTNGFVGVWHLKEGGTGVRYDATKNGFQLVPYNYNGSEAILNGYIGRCDSLRGGSSSLPPPPTSTYLRVSTNMANFSNGFTYYVWANPSSNSISQARLIDFCTDTTGQSENWQGRDNIILGGVNADLRGKVFNANNDGGNITATGAFSANVWQHFAMTVSGTTISLYKNGVLVASGTSTQTIANVNRTWNLFGRSAWTGDPYYQGKFDEIVVAKTVRSADWIKLCYESQKQGATWITFQYPSLFAPVISVHPQSQTKNVGDSVIFSVTATGNPMPTYQWRKNGNIISGATNSIYKITSVTTGDAGSYDVIVSNSQGSVTSNSATLTVNTNYSPPTISSHPQSQTVNLSQSVTFSVTATGNPMPTYQWRKNGNNISGATSSSYTINSVTVNDSGSYDVVVTNSQGSVTSNSARLYICAISSQPANVFVSAGDTANFIIVFLGGPTANYQWQYYSTVTGWTDVNYGIGYNTNSFKFVPTTGDSGVYYRCRITGSCATINSDSALLSVCAPPVITTQPSNQSVIQGENATFSISVSGFNINYAWQRYSGTWQNISGATSSTYSFTAQSSDNGALFRCKVFNTCDTVYSNTASLSVCIPVSISSQPQNQSVTAGQTASFTVTATGSGTLNYQWQYSIDNGTNWGNVTGGSGATSASYSFTSTSSDNGKMFRCVIDNGCGSPVVSNAATLTVCTPPQISSQPQNPGQKIAGESVNLSISVPGNVTNPVYQWERNDGSGWANAQGASATTSTYTFTASGSDNGVQYRCKVTACGVTEISSSVTLSVCVPVSITGQPHDSSVIAGQLVSFGVMASGSGTLYYQWQSSVDNGGTWNDIIGAVNSSYEFTTTSNHNGNRYRCVVSNGCGNAEISNVAVLSVCTPATITSHPSNWSGNAGQTATFSVTIPANVTSPSYQWEKSVDGGNSWSNAEGSGSQSNSYSFTATAQDNLAKFRCKVTAACGLPVYSNVANCTVCSQASILTQPQDVNATAGQNATFTIVASGTPVVYYQWQRSEDGGSSWNDIAGANSSTYTFTAATANNGFRYRCIVSTDCFTAVTSNVAVLNVCTPPIITTQPQSQPGKLVGETATFNLVVAQEVTSPQYQWQKSYDNGSSWNDISGQTNSTYSFTVAQGDDTLQFRCRVYNSCGEIYSTVVSIGVCTPVSISVQPSDVNVTTGQQAKFEIVAGGNPLPVYQWQYKTGSGGVWSNVTSGGNSAEYSFIASSSEDNYSYRCVVSNGCGKPDTSLPAVLRVCTPPNIVAQPGLQDKNEGDTAVFTVTATGSNLTYRWQKSVNLGEWNNVTAGIGGNTSTYKILAQGVDHNSYYRCIVENDCGKDTSDNAILYVCTPPQITMQPQDQNVVSGSAVTFSITAQGTMLTYQWQKSTDNLVWSDIANATSSTYLINAQASDNGIRFRCIVRSKCGDITSASASLFVCDPVKIVSQNIHDTMVLSETQLQFSINVTGTNPTFIWQKKALGDADFKSISNATSSSYSFTAQISDSGCQIRCVASAACGAPATSATANILVFSPLVAAFTVSDSLGMIPLTVNFTDKSTGDFKKRVWDFGDGSPLDSISQNPSHVYSNEGTYTVKLTVSGPAPRNTSTAQKTIFTWKPGSNPIRLDGKYLTEQRVIITISNYQTITPPSPFVSADSVIIWYKAGSPPTSASAPASVLKGYSISQLRSRGTSYLDTLTVPRLTPPDSFYGFANVIVWTDKNKTAIASGNTCTVLMRDTMPIINEIFVTGVYLPDDTAKIILDNISSIDTSRIDSCAIWYSLNSTDSVDFNNRSFTKWLSAKQIVLEGSRYSVFIINPLFNSEKRTIKVAVVLLGKNKRMSNIKTALFDVGKNRPNNPVKLTARVLSANRILLSWNNIVSSGAERIVIWYRSGSPIPFVYDVSSLKLDSLTPLVSDSFIIGSNFNEKTRYYFGAQVYQNGLWSYITEASSATDSTPEAGDTLAYNSIKITKLIFDTTTNKIKVSWSVDPTQAESLQIGILYTTDTLQLNSSKITQVINVKNSLDSSYLALRENLFFNKTYYISLWLRRVGGKWTGPTKDAIDSVKIPAFTWQNVDYFTKDNDTVYAFNNKIRIINTPGDVSFTQNKVIYYPLDTLKLSGLLPVGIAFEFKDKSAGFPFYVGIKVDTIPLGYSFSDVRIYRINSQGLCVIDTKPFYADSVLRYVSVLTNQLEFPFVAMIDTVAPVAFVSQEVNKPIMPDKSITDTIQIHDNIANVKWQFKVTKGGSSFEAGDTTQSGELSDTFDVAVVTIGQQYMSIDNGVRAILIISDGMHKDTINLSRTVIRDTCGVLRTYEMKWTPLSIAMDMDTVEIKGVLKSLVSKDEWNYDTKKFRLFKWYPNELNKNKDSKWVEYADTIKNAFTFTRGNLLWIKTREREYFNLGRGTTASLKEPFKITLQPLTWNDFSLPFKFDMRIGDVLKETSKIGVNADTLQFYAWQKDKEGRYWSEPLFINAFDSLNNYNTILSCTDVAGFTVYNPLPDTLSLVFPAISYEMSNAYLAKKTKTKSEEKWFVRINSSLCDGTRLSSVYCGFIKGSSKEPVYYPKAISLDNTYVAVFDPKNKKLYGHAIVNSLLNGGTNYLLAFVNNSSQQNKILYKIENTNMLPSALSAKIFDPDVSKFSDAENNYETVVVDANSVIYRWLFVGTVDYLAKASKIAMPPQLQLYNVWANNGIIKIRFSLPYSGIDKVKFNISDLRGRIVAQKEFNVKTLYGKQEFIWDIKVNNKTNMASGIYMVKMSALDKNNNKAGIFEKRMLMVR